MEWPPLILLLAGGGGKRDADIGRKDKWRATREELEKEAKKQPVRLSTQIIKLRNFMRCHGFHF